MKDVLYISVDTIDDWWAYFCTSNTHDSQTFVGFLKEREAFGIGTSIWQCIYNTFLDYLEITNEATSFYVWLKSKHTHIEV